MLRPLIEVLQSVTNTRYSESSQWEFFILPTPNVGPQVLRLYSKAPWLSFLMLVTWRRKVLAQCRDRESNLNLSRLGNEHPVHWASAICTPPPLISTVQFYPQNQEKEWGITHLLFSMWYHRKRASYSLHFLKLGFS